MNEKLLAGAALLLALAQTSLARVDRSVNPNTDPLQHVRRVLERDPAAKFDPEAILVRFHPDASPASIAHVRSQVGGTTLQNWTLVPGLEKLLVKGDVFTAINTLKQFKNIVLYAELDYIVHTNLNPNDLNFGNLWGMNQASDADIDAPEAWSTFTGDPNLVIADIDTGVNMTHADLAGNIWTNPGEIAGNGIDDDANGHIDDTRGWDYVNNDNNPTDDNGHGTHTSGTFGATGNNGFGVVGVVWRCKIMPLKFLNASGSGAISAALSSLQYATRKGVRVSNNSWGGGGFSQSFLDALNASQSVGHIFVAAAGNSSSNNDATPSYPASYSAGNVIAVASTTSADGMSSFSSYGATSVDVGAPGSSILSTYGTGYSYLSGTSMATPHVAGVVALVTGFRPTWTWSQIRTQVISTARPIPALAGRCVSGGVVNAAAALGVVVPPPTTIPAAPGTPAITVLSASSLRINFADNSNNETGFTLERQKRVGVTWVNLTTIPLGANVASFTDTPGAGRYRYRVRAFNSAGNSAWSLYGNVLF